MDSSLRRRIEDIVINSLKAHNYRIGFYITGMVDRIMVEVGNEIAIRKAKEAATDEGSKERELPL